MAPAALGVVTDAGRPQRGVVLATVVLLLVAGTLLAHGSLVLARAFHRGADEAWAAVRVRRAVVSSVDRWARRGDTLLRGWSPTGAGSEIRSAPRRLSPELFLLVAEGRDGPARWEAGRLVWRADPITRATAPRAMVRLGGGVAGPGAGSVTVPPIAGCPTAVAPAPLLGLAPGEPRIGPLGLPDLLSSLSPWSPPATACASEGACALAAVAAEGGRRVDGGLHTGLFVVRGDLVLADGARVRGEVLVEGDVVLLDSARIEGALQATGNLTEAGPGGVVGDPCVVADVWGAGLAETVGPVALGRRAWPLWGPPP